jgi:hypothetical protein
VRVLGHFGGGVMVGRDDLAKRAEPGRHLVEHGAIRRAARYFLLQPRHAEAGGPPDRPLVEGDLAGNRLQQARLAAAVPADERDPLAGLDPKVGVFEQGQVAKGKMSLLEMKDGHCLRWHTI